MCKEKVIIQYEKSNNVGVKYTLSIEEGGLSLFRQVQKTS